MKTLKKTLLFVALATSMSVVTSCGGDDPDNDPVPEPETPITPVTPGDTSEAMSAAKQKEYLETVATEFMGLIPSSDFSEQAALGKYISDTYGDDYDWEAVGNWAEAVFDASKEALGIKTTKTEHGSLYTQNYIYTYYNSLLLASNFTGHFTAQAGKWTLSKASDLQFIFTDKAGKECVLKLETSGNVKKVHAFDLDELMDYDINDATYTYKEYYDRTQCTIGVPEKIVVTLTQGGSQVVKTTVSIDLSVTGEEFDISKNSLTVSALVELNNGYKFDCSQVAYTANSKASAKFTMTKNGTALVTAAVAGDISGIPSCNVSAFSSENFNPDKYNTDDANAKNAYVKLDILGKVQMQGTISDIRKYAEYLDQADMNDDNEASYKSFINQANGLTDVNLFYDGKATKQATVKLEPFVDESWNGTTWWTAEPVIHFYDGTSYSTFEAFFNETDFKNVIKSFKKLADQYAGLVDKHIDW